ncbi:hypothetical protein F1880_009554 [Penicillium rolfsii]|nr:hypothetical protein F1880_009554 [Penicillium rolfsii]
MRSLSIILCQATKQNRHAGELDEQEWETVLRNSSYVDMQTKRVKQAPKPAFRLRPGLNMPAELSALPPLLGAKMKTAKPLPPGVDPEAGEITGATGEEDPQESGETPGAPGEGQEEVQHEEEDKETQPASDAGVSTNIKMSNARPLIPERDSARRIDDDDDDENSNHSMESAPKSGSELALEDVSASQPAPHSKSATKTAPAPVSASPQLKYNKPERLPSFPSFTVNDNSKIEVTVAHHEIHVSMAKNNFSMTGFEAAASGSFFGVSASASGGFTDEKATGSGSTSDKKERTMIARYNFPRATLHLRPEDLEITPELKDAITKVQATKDVIYSATKSSWVVLCRPLGLLHLPISSSGPRKKEKFKAEVGASIGFGSFSASTKYKTGKESEDERKQQETQVNDKMLFEATGGSTILAASPPQWASSVLHHNNWRAIERAEMMSLADAIATCHTPGLDKVREWFVNAVSIRSQFIEIPPSRTMMVRLKTIAPIPGKEENALNTNRYYFGYDKRPVHYQRMGVQRRERVVTQDVVKYGGGSLCLVDLTTSLVQVRDHCPSAVFALLQPPITKICPARSPNVCIAFPPFPVEDKFSTLDKYQETVWTMTVMDGEYLRDGSLICLKSYSKDSDLYLTVFRNEQGHYLPAISDAGAAPYWRVQKMQGSGRQNGHLIRDSFRDYMDDVFGRRRFHVPEDEPENLYMKVPFPGFQKSDADGIAMIMHTEETTKSYATILNVLPHKEFDNKSIATYGLYDLSFRLDILDTPGQQELNDFMIHGLNQRSEIVLKDEKRLAQVRSTKFSWGDDSDLTRTAKAVSHEMGMNWQATG